MPPPLSLGPPPLHPPTNACLWVASAALLLPSATCLQHVRMRRRMPWPPCNQAHPWMPAPRLPRNQIPPSSRAPPLMPPNPTHAPTAPLVQAEGAFPRADRIFYLSIPPDVFTAVAGAASQAASAKWVALPAACGVWFGGGDEVWGWVDIGGVGAGLA